MTFSAFFFDFWDTLIPLKEEDLKKVRKQRADFIKNLFKTWGHNVPPEKIYKTSREVWSFYREYHSDNGEVTLPQIINSLLRQLGITPDERKTSIVVNLYERSLIDLNLKCSDGIFEILNYLKMKDKRIGLISNTPGGRVEREIMKRNKIFHYFDALIFSRDVGFRKPDPEIFKRALKKIGVQKERACHTGDRPDLDVLGAKNSKIFSIWFNSRNETYPENFPAPDIKIKHLNELKCLL